MSRGDLQFHALGQLVGRDVNPHVGRDFHRRLFGLKREPPLGRVAIQPQQQRLGSPLGQRRLPELAVEPFRIQFGRLAGLERVPRIRNRFDFSRCVDRDQQSQVIHMQRFKRRDNIGLFAGGRAAAGIDLNGARLVGGQGFEKLQPQQTLSLGGRGDGPIQLRAGGIADIDDIPSGRNPALDQERRTLRAGQLQLGRAGPFRGLCLQIAQHAGHDSRTGFAQLDRQHTIGSELLEGQQIVAGGAGLDPRLPESGGGDILQL